MYVCNRHLEVFLKSLNLTALGKRKLIFHFTVEQLLKGLFIKVYMLMIFLTESSSTTTYIFLHTHFTNFDIYYVG